VRQVTKGPISAGRQWTELSGSGRGQPGRGAGRGSCLSRDAAPGFFGIWWAKRDARAVSPRRAAEHGVVLVGATVSTGPGRSNDQRAFGPR